MNMNMNLNQHHHHHLQSHSFLSYSQILVQVPSSPIISHSNINNNNNVFRGGRRLSLKRNNNKKQQQQFKRCSVAISASFSPLDLTEDNIKTVLLDARTELAQLFDSSVGMTGKAELAELDGPYVKISLKGRFWHERSLVLARLGNYLKQRIPEILEVDIEDEKQLDDSPANF